MNEPHGKVGYPGLPPVESFSYTMGHGITPGTIVCKTVVPPTSLSPSGNLVFTDTKVTIIIPNCRVANVLASKDFSGQTWTVTLEDRRWQWLQFGAIHGCYNQLDPRYKLIPWTVMSPKELATLCLDSMNERGYTIDMPAGLASTEMPDKENFFEPGENTDETGTNPPINWYAMPPAQALQSLCDQFGRRIVYNLEKDTIDIVRAGIGKPLPPGSIYVRSPGLSLPAKPDRVAIIGDPTRYQVRLLLEAVGEDWNGVIRPINALSYAPIVGQAAQVSTVTIEHPVSPEVTYTVWINDVEFSVAQTAGLASTIATSFKTKINASSAAGVKGVVTADSSGGVLTVTAVTRGVAFRIQSDFEVTGAGVAPTVPVCFTDTTVEAATGKADWGHCPPPLFPLVRATDRLTYKQAVALAQKSVWKMYRVCNKDASGNGPVRVPGYGDIDRIQQLVLQDTQVDQVQPEEVDRTFKDREGFSLVVNFYDGYSRDKPAVVYGSVSRWLVDATFMRDTGFVTGPKDQVHVSFSVVPDFQMIVFSSPVYTFDPGNLLNADKVIPGIANAVGAFDAARKIHGGRCVEPRLILQTAVLVRDAETNQFDAYVTSGQTAGPQMGTQTQVVHRPDVQANVTATYDESDNPDQVDELEADAAERAKHYLDGLLLQFPQVPSETRGYNAIMPIWLDGAIQQVSWSIEAAGQSTTASLNGEHHPYVPPYPARRRAEDLSPAKKAADANPAKVNVMKPKGEGAAT